MEGTRAMSEQKAYGAWPLLPQHLTQRYLTFVCPRLAAPANAFQRRPTASPRCQRKKPMQLALISELTAGVRDAKRSARLFVSCTEVLL